MLLNTQNHFLQLHYTITTVPMDTATSLYTLRLTKLKEKTNLYQVLVHIPHCRDECPNKTYTQCLLRFGQKISNCRETMLFSKGKKKIKFHYSLYLLVCIGNVLLGKKRLQMKLLWSTVCLQKSGNTEETLQIQNTQDSETGKIY